MNNVRDRAGWFLSNVEEQCRTPSEMRQQLRLLCATDLSRRSSAAVRRAERLSRQLGAELLIFHSVAAARSERETRRQWVRAHIVLNARARKLARRGALPQIAVQVGPYRETIVKAAREWDADLIILGSYRKRFGDSVWGTTAERLTHTGHRPVLVVNRDPDGAYEQVLLTSDLSSASVGAARVTHALGLLEGSALSVVHALTPAGQSMLRLSGVTELQVEKYVQQTRRWTTTEIRRQLEHAGFRNDRLSITTRQAPALSAIRREMRRTRADLVIVGASRFPTIKRVMLGSVSNEVLRRLDCDVLLVSPNAIKQARLAA